MMKILIVDDDNARSNALVTHLLINGVASHASIATATCVIEAKKLLKTSYYDLLILDVVLPVRDNEKSDGSNGIAFLRQITGQSQYKKPARIIGITAHLSDIQSFKVEFERYCLTVIEAPAGSSVWKDKCAEVISYSSDSDLARSVSETPLHAIAVHGIQTFGEWQTRLAHLISSRTSEINFSAYEYGFFSVPAFCLWPFRFSEVRRLEKHLESLFKRESECSFIIFSHSFGTYLVAHALRRLVAKGLYPRVKLLVLAGSVLPSRFDWSFVEKFAHKGVHVVNDCADADYVLWLSEALVLGTGMAGKTGFYGVNGSSIVNRYFRGGHSSYFVDNSFMQSYWLPLLNSNDSVVMHDARNPSFVEYGLLEKVVSMFGFIKPYIYCLALPAMLIYFLTS